MALGLSAMVGGALVATAAWAQGSAIIDRVFAVAEDKHSLNEVVFTSKASIVRFTGRTSKISGEATINVKDASKASGNVKVDLASLDTGISLRNEHMRGVLETDKYPAATFTFKGIQLANKILTPNAPLSGTARGQLTLHGVTRTMTAPVELTYLPEQDANYRPGDWVHVNARFKIKMSDYGIQLPKPVLGVKVADEIELDVDGMAAASSGAIK
jgi:polyisoprenoid-binding protein YceI